LDSVFVGRLDDDGAQADALRLLKVPVGAGYEQVVASLGRRPGGERGQTERDRAPRQFIFGDGAGGVERIRIDFSGNHLDHLRDALDTTPDAARDRQDRPALPAMPTDLMPEPSPVAGRHAEPDFDDEFAAELEVGLADDYSDDLVPTSSLSEQESGYRRTGRGESA
jgi:hypothetical protein